MTSCKQQKKDSGFDLAYEGLKLAHVLAAKASIVCFDLTYEGLKYEIAWSTHGWRFCFDLTYEGLKFQQLINDIVFIVQVLILPMRDWNIFNVNNSSKYFSAFWSYLWGIEMRKYSLS